jgi:hypothetical protein
VRFANDTSVDAASVAPMLAAAIEPLIGEEAARVWRLYLAGGRLAFAQGRMGVDQILLTRPAATAGRTAQ